MKLRHLIKLLPTSIRHSLLRSKLTFDEAVPENIVFKVAESRDELEQAFRVLHDAYVGQGYMEPDPSGLRVTKYHALPTTTILIAKEINSGVVVATVSIFRNTEMGLPLDSIFPMDELKKKYNHLAEVSSLAIRSDYRSKPEQMLWPLLRYFYTYLRHVMRVDAYVIGVHPSWHDLYTGILGFTKLEGFESAKYNFVNNAPVAAYVVDVLEQEFKFYKFYNHLPDRSNFHRYCTQVELCKKQHKFPQHRYFSVQSLVMSAENFNYFFAQKTDAIRLLTTHEKTIIQNLYPYGLYSETIFGENGYLPHILTRPLRLTTRLDAKIKIEDSFANDSMLSVLDFSRKGLKVKSKRPLPAMVDLRIAVGQFDSCYVTAEMRWQSDEVYGFQIIAADQAWSDFIFEMQSQFSQSATLNQTALRLIKTKAS